MTTIFLGDKHSVCFFNQVPIYCNDISIVDNLYLIYEANIFGATYSNEIKRKHAITKTCTATVTEKSRDVSGVYRNVVNIASDTTIRVAYEILHQ